MVYDANRHLTSTTHADGTSRLSNFNILGQLISSEDESGRVTDNSYDVLGRMTETTNPAGERVTFGYDALDRITSVTSANGAVTTYTYDEAGRLTQESSPDRGTTTYSYHPGTSNIHIKTDGNGTTTEYLYDLRYRITDIQYAANPAYNIHFTYDDQQHMRTMVDRSGTTIEQYNAMGNLSSKSWGNGAVQLSMSYGYDAKGRLNSMTYPSGKVLSYGYDAITGRINSMSFGGQPTLTSAQYHALGGIASQTFGNGTVEDRGHDLRGRLDSSFLYNAANRQSILMGRTISLEPALHD